MNEIKIEEMIMFWMTESESPCADPEGGQGVRPPVKSQKYRVSYKYRVS